MIDISPLDVRDYGLLAVLLVGTYLVFLLLRLIQMNWKRRRAVGSMRAEGSLPEAQDMVVKAEPFGELHREEPRVVPFTGSSPTLVQVTDKSSVPDFARELERSSLEREVQCLRRDADHLRAELAHLTEEMRYLKAARNVSPLYGEAIALAQQGVPAAGIADRCGISIGEAELVAALARSESGFETKQKENDRNDRYAASGN
jgi:hypothetical protein